MCYKPKDNDSERYKAARDKAWERLEKCDAAGLALGHSLEFKGDTGEIIVPYLGSEVAVDLASKKARSISGPALQSKDDILILHYLLSPPGLKPIGELSAFREFEGGMGYERAFQGSAPKILSETFTGCEEKIVPLSEKLGGKTVEHGDVAVEVPIFPNLPVTIIFYIGDDEVPGSVNVLFDQTAGRIFETEDLVVAAITLALRLMFMNIKT